MESIASLRTVPKSSEFLMVGSTRMARRSVTVLTPKLNPKLNPKLFVGSTRMARRSVTVLTPKLNPKLNPKLFVDPKPLTLN
jgi:hypothetical protein